MAFLQGLGKIVNDQFGFGENSVDSLDPDGTNRVRDFGNLGKFIETTDKTAERTYAQDGFVRNIRPRLREVIWQKPELAVLIKKRMFSSLVENYKLSLLDSDEKLFYRASKKLFQNKARAIAAYERLSKVEKLAQETGVLNTHMIPTVFGGIAELEALGITSIFDAETRAAFSKLRKVFAFSKPNLFTTWINPNNTAFTSETGDGTGVLELTMVSNVNTRISTEFGAGGASLSIEDPYKLTKITNEDIDKSISDATNLFRASTFGRFTQQQTSALIESQISQLNAFRTQRGVSPISIKTSPQTLISKRVRAIMDFEGREINFQYDAGLVGIGSSVEIDPQELIGQTELFNPRVADSRLSSEEAQVFREIIQNTFLLIGYENTTNSQIREFNEQTNYVRRKMRLHYANKSIIQPMDIVSIFIKSNSQTDDKLIQGFESQGNRNFNSNILSTLNTLVRNLNNFGDKFQQANGKQISMDEIEKNSIAGPDFPHWLWNMFKSDFTRQDAGLCVFTGIVKDPSRNYDNGFHTLTVECEDNSGYFNKSEINLKPAMDVFNGSLYDPLTPFDLTFDASTGDPITESTDNEFPPLLQENEELLGTDCLRFKAGRFRGTRVRDFLYKANEKELAFGGFRRVLNAPDGLVYRWKEGIQSLTKTSRANTTETSIGTKDKSPLLTKNPFAGQDVMNVLSLLITGQPYNFNTFLKAAIENVNGVITHDELDNEDSSVSYIDGLVSDLSKRNAVWGNFVPFKKLTINEAAKSFIETGRKEFTRKNQKLNVLINKRAKLLDQLFLLKTGGFLTEGVGGFERDATGKLSLGDSATPEQISIANEIEQLDVEIEKSQQNFLQSVQNIASANDGNIKLIGDDLSLDPSFSEGQNALTERQEQINRGELRQKVEYLTLRRLWQVKANDDPNLFIVDDQYDNSFDIQAFERAISADSLNLFSSEYTNVEEQIKNVASLLSGFEVFADSQGHIQARPPQYNKVPSSVFYKLFKDKAQHGVQVFPQFLESLFANQIDGLMTKIEVIEDQIRFRGAALGLSTDKEVIDFISQNTSRNFGMAVSSVSSTEFSFVSDESTGKIDVTNVRKFAHQARAEEESKTLQELESLGDTLNSATRNQVLFDSFARSNAALKRNFVVSFSDRAEDRAFRIRQRLRQKKGVKVPTVRELFSNEQFRLPAVSQIDLLKLINEMTSLASERQNALKVASNAVRNMTQGLRLNQDKGGANAGLFPMLTQRKHNEFPEILEHMIEDESNHSLGPGSGARFIIRDHQIINYTVKEVAPPYTMVQVDGLFAEGFIDAPTNLRLNSSGGNALTSAFAVDYSLWQMYGFRASNSIPARFFSNPQSQCAPYAVFLLNLARKNILQGSITLVGNEYYQAGDVVYIEDEDLLFYVNSVQHQFSYSGDFTTTLNLTYGHPPGEYIPTVLDIVGRVLYSAQDAFAYRNIRFSPANGDISVGSIIYDNQINFTGNVLNSLLNGPRGEYNRKIITNTLIKASETLNQQSGRTQVPRLEIRIYTNSESSSPNGNQALLEAAEELKKWLSNPQQESGGIIIPQTGENIGFRINPNVIRTKLVDVTDTPLSPSSSAWHSVRTVKGDSIPRSQNIFVIGDVPGELCDILYKNIIDIWITFDEAVSTLDSQQPGIEINNQRALLEAAARQRAEDRRRNQG